MKIPDGFTDKWEYFEHMLRTHHWHWSESSDHVVVREGRDERILIDNLYMILAGEDRWRTTHLFSRYCPGVDEEGEPV